MKKNSIAKNLFPPICLELGKKGLDALQGMFLESFLKKSFQNNSNFRNIHFGKRCFVIGTGPSIKSQNLLPLKNELCISVSQFYLHPDFAAIKPAYHVHAPNHEPFDFADVENMITSQNAAFIPYSPICFYGHRKYECSYYNFLRINCALDNTNTHFINYEHHGYINENNYLSNKIWDIARKPFQPSTVIFCAIQLAAYMGVKEIYLLGCDHDYLSDIKRTNGIHFYEEKEGLDDFKNLGQFDSEHFFHEYYMRWKRYRLMRWYLEKNNININNATKGGMLDVFKRVDYESLF